MRSFYFLAAYKPVCRDSGTISVAHNATAEQREIAREAMLSVIGQADGTLTIAADGEMPERDIPVYIILLG